MGFNWIIKTQVSNPINSSARLWRSTGPRVDRPDRSTDVHKDVHAGQPLGPVDRLKSAHSRVDPVYRAVDRPESRCSLVLGTVDQAVDRQAQRSNFFSLAGRPAGRPEGYF